MGKESKLENKSGINLLITVRDGMKRIDELEIKPTKLFVTCLSFEALRSPLSSDITDLEKERLKFIELKRFIEKYEK